MTTPVGNPFQDPATPPSTFPTQASFRGRLLLITPRKLDVVPNNMNPGTTQDRITADVTVVDGLGPVPQMKEGNHTGGWLEGPDFTGVWFTGQRVVDQMRSFVGTGQSVLSVIETYQPGQPPRKGNPWGLVTATDEQKNQARAFLASRTVGAAAAPVTVPAPVQYAPQVQQQAPAAAPVQAPVPAPATAPVAPPAPGPVAAPQPAAANPFLQQAPAQAAPATVNPFLQQAPQQ